MKKQITSNLLKIFCLVAFVLIGVNNTYSQATYVSKSEAMTILSNEMTSIETKDASQMTKLDDLMEDVSKELMHRIDGGTTVENAINDLFQEYLDRVADINSTTEEINEAKAHTIDMLKVK